MSEVSDRLNAALSGRYAIEREVGAGGMATVYLARDLKHNRKVALKVLRPELAAVVGAERFLAEIQVTANLQHPHLLPLFDSGTADSFLFYVMPYVEGESLRDRLDREHQLPVDDSVQIAKNLAEALDYAHRHDVIHRDIKPANVLLLDGKPVISDFGIALAVGVAGGGRLTETGLSLGTPHYMSPEQATGDAHVGPATDIYALGCVLYEMLVGEPPYTGNTAQAVLGKIIAGAPVSAARQRSSIPANVDAAIRKALEKVPADRFATSQDFAKALTDPRFRHGELAVGLAQPPGRSKLLAAAILILGLALGVASDRALAKPEPARLARFALNLPEGHSARGMSGVKLAWSPDGSRTVYAASSDEGGFQLWQRLLDQLEPQLLLGSAGASNPAFSPDGSSVAFTTGGSLKTLPLAGGPAFTVVAEGVEGGIDWDSDGMLYFTNAEGSLARVPASGGPPEALTEPETGTRHWWVAALPEGKGLLFTVIRGQAPELSEIAVRSKDGTGFRILFAGAMARYARSGHVVYTAADGALMAAPFDLRRLEVTGPSVALLQDISIGSGSASAFALSQKGALLYYTRESSLSQLVRVARNGDAEEIDPGWTARFSSVALSPDEARLAVSIVTRGTGVDPPQDVWIKQLDRGPLSKLSFEGRANMRPAWTPDSRSLTFASNRSGNSGETDVWMARADGIGAAQLLLNLDRDIYRATWSSDGVWLLVEVGLVGDARDIFAWRPAVDSAPQPLLATPFNEFTPRLSPDGRWLAYVSDESGRNEVYVRPFPKVDEGKWQISIAGGGEPLWAHTGGELFYRNGDLEMVAVTVSGTATFQAGEARVLFSAADYLTYAVARDDQHFIMIRQLPDESRQELIVVENFFEDLKARVGR